MKQYMSIVPIQMVCVDGIIMWDDTEITVQLVRNNSTLNTIHYSCQQTLPQTIATLTLKHLHTCSHLLRGTTQKCV